MFSNGAVRFHAQTGDDPTDRLVMAASIPVPPRASVLSSCGAPRPGRSTLARQMLVNRVLLSSGTPSATAQRTIPQPSSAGKSNLVPERGKRSALQKRRPG